MLIVGRHGGAGGRPLSGGGGVVLINRADQKILYIYFFQNKE